MVSSALPKAQGIVADLVRQRQDETDYRLLIGRSHGKNVAADALGFLRLVEQPVAFRLREGPGQGIA